MAALMPASGTETSFKRTSASLALDIARALIADGQVERGWLGIDARDITDSLHDSLGVAHGIVVLGVMGGGPADRAGIRPGDVLRMIDGFEITDSREAIERIAALKPGSEIPVGGVRDRREFVTTVQVSRRPMPR